MRRPTLPTLGNLLGAATADPFADLDPYGQQRDTRTQVESFDNPTDRWDPIDIQQALTRRPVDEAPQPYGPQPVEELEPFEPSRMPTGGADSDVYQQIQDYFHNEAKQTAKPADSQDQLQRQIRDYFKSEAKTPPPASRPAMPLPTTQPDTLWPAPRGTTKTPTGEIPPLPPSPMRVNAPFVPPEHPAAGMSSNGLASLKQREGFRGTPYNDMGTGLAIGYGFTTWKGKPVTADLRITPQEADEELARQVTAKEQRLLGKLDVPVTQAQYDALASVAWNHERTAKKIIDKLNAGETPTQEDFTWSATVKGQPVAGLMKRRLEEYAPFAGMTARPPRKAPPAEPTVDAEVVAPPLASLREADMTPAEAPLRGEMTALLPGQLAPGNIDLYNRPAVTNADGTISTVRSMSFNEDGKEILIPTVVGDRVVSNDEAIAEYHRTGQHLGVFDTPEAATAYATKLHEDAAAGVYDKQEAQTPFGPLPVLRSGEQPTEAQQKQLTAYLFQSLMSFSKDHAEATAAQAAADALPVAQTPFGPLPVLKPGEQPTEAQQKQIAQFLFNSLISFSKGRAEEAQKLIEETQKTIEAGPVAQTPFGPLPVLKPGQKPTAAQQKQLTDFMLGSLISFSKELDRAKQPPPLLPVVPLVPTITGRAPRPPERAAIPPPSPGPQVSTLRQIWQNVTETWQNVTNRSVMEQASDQGLSALQGMATINDALISLADVAFNSGASGGGGVQVYIPPEARPAFGKVLEQLGYSSKENRELLERFKSAAAQEESRRLDAAKNVYAKGDQERFESLTLAWIREGLDPEEAAQRARAEVDQKLSLYTHGKRAVAVAITALKNPWSLTHTTIQSAPLMIAGALAAPEIMAAGVSAEVAGAIAEGATSWLAAREQVRQNNPDGGALSPGQEAAVLGSGFTTGLIGYYGNVLSARLGVKDVDTIFAAARVDPGAKKSFVAMLKAVPTAMIQEGAEEFAQGIPEQVLQNIAEGKPWHEGVEQNAVMGMFAGAMMAGPAQFHRGGGEALRIRTDTKQREAIRQHLFGSKAERTLDQLLDLRQELQVGRQNITRPGGSGPPARAPEGAGAFLGPSGVITHPPIGLVDQRIAMVDALIREKLLPEGVEGPIQIPERALAPDDLGPRVVDPGAEPPPPVVPPGPPPGPPPGAPPAGGGVGAAPTVEPPQETAPPEPPPPPTAAAGLLHDEEVALNANVEPDEDGSKRWVTARSTEESMAHAEDLIKTGVQNGEVWEDATGDRFQVRRSVGKQGQISVTLLALDDAGAPVELAQGLNAWTDRDGKWYRLNHLRGFFERARRVSAAPEATTAPTPAAPPTMEGPAVSHPAVSLPTPPRVPQLQGWLGELAPEHHEPVFAAMRAIDARAQAYHDEARKLTPPHGTIGVGMADKAAFQQGEARSEFLRALNRGATPEEAGEAAKTEARFIATKANARRPNDIHSHLPPGAVDASIDDAVRAITRAAPAPEPRGAEITDEDFATLFAKAMTEEAERPPGPRWRPGRRAEYEGHEPEDVIALTQKAQHENRVAIARLEDRLKTLEPGSQRHQQATEKLHALQATYAGLWAELGQQMDEVDVPALTKQIEAAAKTMIDAERAVVEQEEKKKEKEQAEKKAEKPEKKAAKAPEKPKPAEKPKAEAKAEPKTPTTGPWSVGDQVIYKSESGLVTAVAEDGQVHVTVTKEVPGKKPKTVDLVVAPSALVRDPHTAAQGARLSTLMEKEDSGAALTAAEEDELADLESTLKNAMDESEVAARPAEPGFQPPVQDYTLGEDRMDPADIFPPPETTTRFPNVDHEAEWHKRQAEGYFITPAEAAERLAAWKAEAARLGQEEDNSRKVIYSLFDRTGNWSQPFVDAGYVVRRYDITNGEDLLRFFPTADIDADKAAGLEIVGVLAAPPCPTFTLSATRWWKTKHDQDNQEHLEKLFGYAASDYFTKPIDYATALIDVTTAFVELAAPTRFHVLENPIGRLHTSLEKMPQPTLVFHPAHFGDPQTKKTYLWGTFNPDLPTAPVYPTKGSFVSEGLRGDDPVEKLERSATSEHFAYAFFMGNRFDAQEQAPAEGEPAAPTEPRVIAFRSGNQSAVNDLVGFIKAGQDVGVTALGMTGPVRDEIVKHVAGGGNAFIDSGAFGKTEIVNGRGVPKINFKAVMSAYRKLAADVVVAGGNAGGLYVVAPDVAPAFVDPNDQNTVVSRKDGVPRSFPDETRAIQEEYGPQIGAALDAGLTVIVPVQVGPTMAARAVEVLNEFSGAMIGLPGNQRAISDAQLTEMLDAIKAAGQDPHGFHFLGIGEENRRFKQLVAMVHWTFPDAVITVDSSRAQAMFVEGRPAQEELKDRVLQYAAADVDEAWESDTTELAGEFFRGNFDSFTTAEMERLAEALNTTPSVLQRRAGQPEQVLARVEESGLEDAFFEALWYIARDRGAGRKSVTTKARTDVIAETDHPARTFKYGEAATHEGRPAVVQSFLPEHPNGPSYQIQATEADGRTVFMTVPATELEKAKKATSQPATSRPVVAQGAAPDLTKTAWMNEGEIEEAVERFADHPILGPAARFLEAFKEQVNKKSDGWPYWKQPGHAAGRLMNLLNGYLRAGMGAYPRLREVTAADVQATLPPIKSFMTRRGTEAGMTMPALDLPTAAAPETTRAFTARDGNGQTRTFTDSLEASVWNALHSTEGALARIAKGRRLEGAAWDAFVRDEIGISGGGHDGYSYEVTKKNGAMRVTGPQGTTTYPLSTVAKTARRLLDAHRPLAAAGEEKQSGWAETVNGLTRVFVFATEADRDTFIEQLQAYAKTVDHDPDVTKFGPKGIHAVQVTYVTHDAGDTVTEKDHDGAREADRLAKGAINAVQEPGAATGVVREGPRAGEEVREGDTEGGEAPGARAPQEGQEVADRPKYPDGRLIPIVGDKVYQTVPGFGGSAAYIYGEVFKGRKNELRVKMTSAASLMGGASSSVGKTQWLDYTWTVVDDPEVGRRKAAREQAEKDRAEQYAREEAEFQVDIRRKANDAIRERGHLPLTRDTPVGARVLGHHDDEIGTVDEQHPEYGPLVDGRTIGNADSDGAWGGYSVLPDQVYSVGAAQDAFRLTEAQVEAGDVLRQRLQVEPDDLRVAKDGEAADGALRQLMPDRLEGLRALRSSLRPATTFAEAREAAQEFVTRPITNLDTGVTASVSQTALRKMLSESSVEKSISPTAHSTAVANIDKLFPLAILTEARPSKKTAEVQTIRRFDVPMPVGLDVVRVRILTKTYVDPLEGTRLYTVEAIEIGPPWPGRADAGSTGAGALGEAASSPERSAASADVVSTFAQMVEAVKGTDILYQRAEPFYSRLQRAVEETPMQKATGYKWKGVIAKWAKGKPTPTIGTPAAGVSQADYVFAHVDDLENHKEYTKQEALDYLKANELQVVPVILGEQADIDPRSNADLRTILRTHNYTVEAPIDDDHDPLVLLYDSDPIDIDDLDIEIPPQVVDAYNALNRRHLEPTDDAARAERWSEPGGDPGTYREVVLRLPTDQAKTMARDRAQARVDYVRDQLDALQRGEAGDMTGLGLTDEDMEQIGILAGDMRAAEDAHDEEAADLRRELEEAEDELRAREKALGGWKDGHVFYDDNSDYDNPIVRVRFDIRTQPDGTRVMFLQEVQVPKTGQPMPAELRKHAAPIGFKWALRFAAENGLDRVAFTTGEMQAHRYAIEKVVDSIDWIEMPVVGEGHGILRGFKGRGDDLNAQQVFSYRVHRDEIKNYIGDLAAPLLAQPRNPQTGVQTLDREGMKVGGRGLKNLYDKVYPALVNDIPAVRAAGVKVETRQVSDVDGPKKFGSITLENWVRAYGEDAAENALARKFRDNVPLDEILDSIGAVDNENEDSGVQSLEYLHGDAIRQTLEDDYSYGAEDENAPTPEVLARAVIAVIDNRGYDTDALWLQGEPAMQVPGLDITPALREAVLGGQPLFQGAQGATEFMVDGKAIIRGFEGANISTFAHELFHVARRHRLNRSVPVAQRGGITDADLAVFEEWAGATNGWTVEAEEKAARGFERVLRDGLTFSNPVVQKVFDAIKQWMLTIYVQLEGSALDIHITPEVRAILSKLVGAEVAAAVKTEQPASRLASQPPTSRSLVQQPTPLDRPIRLSEINALDEDIAARQAGSFIVEVKPVGEDFGARNNLRFATREEAEQNGNNLLDRWSGAEDMRVVESTEAPNYRWNAEEGRSEALPPPPPALSPERAAIEAERAAVLAENVELMKKLRARLNQVSMNGLDTDAMMLVAGLARNYVVKLRLNFREAALMFRETYGEDAKAEHYFEVAWIAAQEVAKGKTFKEAMTTATTMKNRPTVAAEVKAYTESGGTSARGTTEAADVVDRPGRGAESGGGLVQPVRDGGAGALGTVPAEPDSGTAGAGAVETGGSYPQSGPSPDVSGVADVGGEPGAAPGPSLGAVPAGSLPTAGGTAGPVGITGHKPSDYQLTPERIAGIINRTDMPRLKDNIAAIRLVKDLQTDNRYATPEEQELLAKYVGWGATGMAQYLAESPGYDWSENQKALWAELRELTTPQQRAELVRSATNAHFTYDLYGPIWRALEWFGFTGGRVLEPSIGTGHALGFMAPTIRKNSTITGTELEPLTAAIASYLYPSARIQPVSYEDIRLPRNTQDLAISNVPFGKFKAHDKMFSGALKFLNEKLHSYFFAKAMEHVRPGGYIVFITSRYTMDGVEHTDIRRHLMTKGHFVGAVRLPGGKTGAFVEGAKTEVVTDLIVLQKFAEGETEARNADAFIQVQKLEAFSTPESKDWRGRKVPAYNVWRSAWYAQHPQFILGTETTTGSMRRSNEYTVERTEGEDLQAKLEDALKVILPKDSYQPATTTSTTETPAVVEGAFKPGELRAGPKNTIQRVLLNGEIIDATPTNKKDGSVDVKKVRRIVGQIGIRDARRAVVTAMLSSTATETEIKKLRGQLLRAYNAFVKEHGTLNDRANTDAFKLDPEAATLRGLEVLKTTSKLHTNKFGKKTLRVTHEVVGTADIFRKRTINVPPQITHVDSPSEALLASLGTRAKLDWAFMARVTGTGEVSEERIAKLQQTLKAECDIFEQPDGAWITRDEYLSGDVVSKLADATAAAEHEPERYKGNVDALTAVQPVPKTAEEIQIALGVHWVEPTDMARFVDQAVGRRGTEMRLDGSEQYVRWTTNYPDEVVIGGYRHPLAVRYGADNERTYGFTDLLDDALNLKTPDLGYTVKDPVTGTRTFVKQESQTLAARANLEELRNLWTQWVYQQRDVLDRIVDVYNTRYNRTVKRAYDGNHLANYRNEQGAAFNDKGEPFTALNGGVRTAALPGLALEFGFYKHQLRAVWRILTSGNTLLAHEVGAGKTFEMIAAAMEMKRTGRARKPLITVPTHLLAQWRKDIVKAYPTAKLLAFDEKDLAADRRQEAMSRIAHGDWDIVLVPHSSFELLKVSKERMAQTLQEWIDEITAVEESMRAEHGNDDLSVKKMEDARRRIEDKARALLEKADKGEDNALTWESLGVDALMVDEAHVFKNLYFFSKMDQIRGLSRSNADKSLDLFIKIKEINESSNYRNLVLATATPVMNSLAEVYTMQRYLQPQRLRDLGFENFDNWYATFAQAKTLTEQRPDGSYQEVQRVAKFRNGKLLYRIASEVMDYVSWDDMPYLKLPKLKNGRITIVQGEPHPMYDTLQRWFTRRLAAIRETPPHWDRNRREYIAPDRFHPITGDRMMGPDGWAKDNILTVMGDAKKAAIDARLVLGDHAKDVPSSRVQSVAKHVSEFYKRETAKKGVALLFLDVGTPKTVEPLAFLEGATVEDTTGGEALGVEDSTIEGGDEDAAALATADTGDFNMYGAIKKALIARGVKSDEIAFIHEARNAAERLALFQAAQEGRIRVLLASTDKGGLGMNIQDRLGMIVEVDAPRAMRPGDIRQRHGRGIRQGNSYKEIEILRFVTKGTTDEWLYGLLGKKQSMITDFMRGELDEYEDDDPTTMSLEEAEVRATNDPRKIELLTLNTSLPRLEAQAVAAERALAEARADADRDRKTLTTVKAAAERLGAWVTDQYKRVAGDDFAVTIGDQAYTSRTEANTALMAALKPIAEQAVTMDVYDMRPQELQKVGEIRGLPILAGTLVDRYSRTYQVQLVLDADVAGEGEILVGLLTAGTKGAVSPTFGEGRNLVASIQDRYNNLPSRLHQIQEQMARAEERIARFEQMEANPSEAPKKIAAARARIAEIEAELRAESAVRDVEARRAHQEAQTARRQAGDMASEGDYAEIPTSTGSVTIPLHPIEFPELVEIAELLTGVAPSVVMKFGGPHTRGRFTVDEQGTPRIVLRADLFKKGNEQQLAAVIAHEIGHAADWLPDHILTRGNLLGHLRTLERFRLGRYTSADGTTITDAKVRAELKALSKKWRPWDPEETGESYATYRNSAKELYADAISVLLNNAGLAQHDAPVFFKEFFAELDRKPEVKEAFFTMWRLMSGGSTREEIIARRDKRMETMFGLGNTKSIDLLELGRRDRRLNALDAVYHFGTVARNVGWGVLRMGAEKHEPVLRRLYEDRKAQRQARGDSWIARAVAELKSWGPGATQEQTVAPDQNPYYALSERTYRVVGQVKAWLQETIQPIRSNLQQHKLTWVDFGKVLTYERIIGERADIANPLGLSPTSAQEQLDALQARWTELQQGAMARQVYKFRGAVKAVARAAYEAGLYTEETWKQIRENDTYATFHSLDHIDDPLTSGIRHQVGSVKDIRNPADATTEKVRVTLRAIEYQRTKQIVLGWLERDHPGDIQDANVDADGRPMDPPIKDRKKWALVKYFVKGKLVGKYVDPYMAESIESNSALANHIAVRILAASNKPFKELVTVANPGFQSYNLPKDFLRFWKAMPQFDAEGRRAWLGMTPWRAVARYWQAREIAAVRAYGLASPQSTVVRKGYRAVMGLTVDPLMGAVDTMRGRQKRGRRRATVPTLSEAEAWEDLLQAEKAGIISTDYSDQFGQGLEPQLIDNILRAEGVTRGKPSDRAWYWRPLVGLREFMLHVGTFIETLPRAAAMYEFKGEGEIADIPADARQFIRTRIGTPDALAGGTLKPVINNTLVFSNIMTQAWLSDFRTATEPTTKAGYWFKTAMVHIVPKVLVGLALMAAAGADGDDDEEKGGWVTAIQHQLAQHPWLVEPGRILRKVPMYALMNYIVIPLRLDELGNAVIARLPQDETGRFGGAMWWYLFTAARNRDFWAAVSGAVDYTQGQLPGFAPILKVPIDIGAYASGHNVYDPFHHQWLLSDAEQEARKADNATWEPFNKKFIAYEFQQVGLGVFYKLYMSDTRPVERTPFQKFLDFGGSWNIFGRYINVTNQGEVERLRAPGDKVRANRAQRTLTERQAVDQAFLEFQQLPAGQQTKSAAERAGRDLARSLYPAEQGAARERSEKRLGDKFKLSAVKGKVDTLGDRVLMAESNDEKLALILGARWNYTDEQFENWLREAVRQDVIAPQVLIDVHKRMQQSATVH